MRSWGKQGFLNAPDDDDSGWYKFSVRPSKRAGDIGYSYVFYLADCHEKISLDFWTTKSPRGEDGEYKKSHLLETRDDVKKRLKKVRLLREAVIAAMDKFEEALLDTDKQVQEELDKIK